MNKFLSILSKIQVLFGSVSLIKGYEGPAIFAIVSAVYFLLLSKEYA